MGQYQNRPPVEGES